MTDPREMLARLGVRTMQYDRIATGAHSDGINIVDWALRKVPAGLGRDLMLYLYAPGASREELWRLYEGVREMLTNESLRLETEHQKARVRYGALVAGANYRQDTSESTRREVEAASISRATSGYSRWPESLDDRLPALIVLLVEHMASGAEASNRKKAKLLKMDESTYRDRWHKIYNWALVRLTDLEAQAARALGRALAEERRAG